MQRSKSASNRLSPSSPSNVSIPINTTPRRRSAGCIKRINSYGQLSSAIDSNLAAKNVWRSPGHCQIPNVLGNAYLKPELPTTLDLRPMDTSKRVSNRPWYPPSPYYEIPQPPPLIQKSDNEFERKLCKILKNVRVRTADPRLRYSHFQEIGTGVNGAVVRARYQRKPSVQVAIKRCIFYPDREYRQAIVRELSIMASRHPNLIRLREVSIWRDDIWISMDLMRSSVFSILCRRGIPEQYAVYITCETLKAMIYLHAVGYLHRDIKCENILLGKDGQVKLADFGLSACIDRHNRDRLGTNKWMAPELIRQEVYNEKIDMWSLGITIIEMMDRVPPHYLIKNENELFHVITTEPGPTFKYSYPSIYMRGLVAWLLDEEPLSRPSANDVLMELDVHIKSNLLPCSSPTELARFIGQVLPSQ